MTNRSITHSDLDDSLLAWPAEASDPLDQMALADRADWLLMRLVLCAAAATLMLALAASISR